MVRCVLDVVQHQKCIFYFTFYTELSLFYGPSLFLWDGPSLLDFPKSEDTSDCMGREVVTKYRQRHKIYVKSKRFSSCSTNANRPLTLQPPQSLWVVGNNVIRTDTVGVKGLIKQATLKRHIYRLRRQPFLSRLNMASCDWLKSSSNDNSCLIALTCRSSSVFKLKYELIFTQ